MHLNQGKNPFKGGLFQTTMLAISKYFPGVPQRVYIIGMSRVMELSIKILVQLLKPSLKGRMLFVDRIDQIEEISLDEVPVHADGRNNKFVRIPPGVKSGKCLPHLSYVTNKEWDNYRAINAIAIEEGMREEGIRAMDQYLRSCDK